MRNRLPVVFFMSIIFILSSFLIPPQVGAQSIGGPIENKEMGEIDWKLMETETKDKYNLAGVSGSSPTDVYAVGEKGVILHYDGDGNNDGEKDYIWEVISRRDGNQLTNKNLNAVWVSSGKAVFIAGDNGTLLVGYKGVHWSMMSSSSKAHLFGVWGSSDEDVFAVGAGGTILHYDGDGNNDGAHDDIWEAMETGIKNQLNGIRGDAPDNIFAVGNAGVILHYDGEKWTPIKDLSPSITKRNLKAIWGSAHSFFAVGDAGIIPHYYKDKKWSPIESNTEDNLNCIAGFSPINIFAIGASGSVLHYKGKKWSRVKSFPAIKKDQSLRALWVSANPHIYIIGNGGIIIVGGTYTAFGLHGHIKNIIDGQGIGNANIYVKDASGVYQPSPTKTTLSTGNVGYFDCIDFSTSPQTLKFSHANFITEADHTIVLQQGSKIPINAYLLPISATNDIVGIVTKLCQAESNYYDCPVGGAVVRLYAYIGDSTNCIFSHTPYRSATTDAEGRYHFSSVASNLYQIKVAPSTYCSNGLEDYVTMSSPPQPVKKDFQYAVGSCLCTAGCPYP